MNASNTESGQFIAADKILISIHCTAVLNVRMQLNNFIYAVILGIAQASSPVIGMFYGEEDKTAVRDTLNNALRLGFLTSICINERE